jgi:hypothetical protein
MVHYANPEVAVGIFGPLPTPLDAMRAVGAFFHARIRLGNSLPAMLLASYLGIPLASIGHGAARQG